MKLLTTICQTTRHRKKKSLHWNMPRSGANLVVLSRYIGILSRYIGILSRYIGILSRYIGTHRLHAPATPKCKFPRKSVGVSFTFFWSTPRTWHQGVGVLLLPRHVNLAAFGRGHAAVAALVRYPAVFWMQILKGWTTKKARIFLMPLESHLQTPMETPGTWNTHL